MSGDGANVLIPRDADVYVQFDFDPNAPQLPADVNEAFGAAWHQVGLLDPDAGSVETRGGSKDDKYAWGGVLYRVLRSKFKLTRTFTAIERNAITDRLDHPGSIDGTLVVPDGNVERVLVAFEFIEGDDIVRLITANYAEVERNGTITDKESDASAIPFVVTVFPNPDTKALLVRQSTRDITGS